MPCRPNVLNDSAGEVDSSEEVEAQPELAVFVAWVPQAQKVTGGGGKEVIPAAVAAARKEGKAAGTFVDPQLADDPHCHPTSEARSP